MRTRILAGSLGFSIVALMMVTAAHVGGQGAAALTGVVSSQAEGTLEGVVVSARRTGSTLTVSVMTDVQGRYAFPVSRLEPGAYTLRIRATGYDLEGPSSVDVAAARSGSWVEIAVRDRGPGMTAAEIDRAFDRFWRSGGGDGGFGLGLTIAHRLVQADGGQIELRPRADGGLEAIVRLKSTTGA